MARFSLKHLTAVNSLWQTRIPQLRQVRLRRKSPVFRHARVCVIIGEWRVQAKRGHAKNHRAPLKSGVFLQLGSCLAQTQPSLERRRSAQSNEIKLTEWLSRAVEAAADALFYIPIKRVAPMLKRVPARNIKPVNSMWSSDFTQLAEEKNGHFKFSSTAEGAEHFQRKRSPRSALREVACVSCALPFFVFTAAVVRASLDRVAGGPHRCAAVSLAVINIAAEPESPESSQWLPRKEREAGSLRALIG